MKKFLFASLVALTSLSAACSDDGKDDTPADVVFPADIAIKVNMREAAVTADQVPKFSANDLPGLSRSVNAFTHDFDKELDHSASYVVSAYSIHSALSMAAYGAANKTKAELDAALHLDSDADAAAKANGGLRTLLRYDGQGASKFNIANRIWFDNDFPILDSFTKGLADHYLAEPQIIDSNADPQIVADIINTWVSYNTNAMIPSLVEKEDVHGMRLMIVNAVAFDGKWKTKFDKKNTSKESFRGLAGVKTVDMMHNSEIDVRYAYDDEKKFAAVKIPYEGDKFSMVVVLPDADDGISSIATDAFDGISWMSETVKLSLPKFRIETEVDSSKNIAILGKLGVKDAFANGTADFSKTADDPDLAIAAIIHKAVIVVDEEGTKAAAATYIGENDKAVGHEFRADHPFAFAIVHNDTGTILFSGQYLGDL